MLILTHSSKKHRINSLLFFFLSFWGMVVLGVALGTSHILGKYFTTEMYSQPHELASGKQKFASLGILSSGH